MKKAFKAFIRKSYLSKRDSLTPIERREKSRLICERLLSHTEFQKAKTCLIYASFRSEVETDLIIDSIIKKGKRLALPIINNKSKKLLLGEIKNRHKELVLSAYGIREPMPRNEILLSPKEIDLFILPGVAFDISGTRLGYGGGYYDRLLSEVPSKPIFGLAFEVQIAFDLPFEESDVRIKKIFTEERVIDCINSDIEQLCYLEGN